MCKLLVAAILLAGITPAHAANERAVRALRHFAALRYYQHYGPSYHGTALLPGANRRRGLGEAPLNLRESTRREIKAARDQRWGQKYVSALDH